MLSHGIISSALFLCIGILYDRYHTRLLAYYGGLNFFMPLLSLCFLFFTLANVGFPGTSSFVGEFLIILGNFEYNTVAIFLSATSLILGAVFAFYLYNRIFFGPLNNTLRKFTDINKREFFILTPLVIVSLTAGIHSNIYFDLVNIPLYNIMNTLKFTNF
jgi:NADH-quinone oxidoreductase subunit M